jgi:hypothetical protein
MEKHCYLHAAHTTQRWVVSDLSRLPSLGRAFQLLTPFPNPLFTSLSQTPSAHLPLRHLQHRDTRTTIHIQPLSLASPAATHVSPCSSTPTATMNSDMVNRSFTKGYNELKAQFDAIDATDYPAIDACIAQCRLFLAERAIPRYHTIRTMLLYQHHLAHKQMRSMNLY